MNESTYPDVLTPEQRKIFDEVYAEMQKAIQPIIDECRRSEIITAADLAITINTRAD